MHVTRKTAMTAAGIALATGAVLSSAGTAQAAGISMGSPAFYDTGNCPCSLYDYHDDTLFKHDAGGKAAKAFLYKGGVTGKVEFHPYNEEIWLYDTKSDGDTFYVRYLYHVIIDDIPKPRWSGWYGPGNGGGPTIDASFDEGTPVTVVIYDAKGDESSRIGSFTARA